MGVNITALGECLNERRIFRRQTSAKRGVERRHEQARVRLLHANGVESEHHADRAGIGRGGRIHLRIDRGIAESGDADASSRAGQRTPDC